MTRTLLAAVASAGILLSARADIEVENANRQAVNEACDSIIEYSEVKTYDQQIVEFQPKYRYKIEKLG